MTRVWSWTEVALHDKAVDLHNLGYRSYEPMEICRRFDMPYERAVKVCKYLKEIEDALAPRLDPRRP